MESVFAMVRHFQGLFDVTDLDGVYAAMSRLYQQVEQTKNVFKQLKASLKLGKIVRVEIRIECQVQCVGPMVYTVFRERLSSYTHCKLKGEDITNSNH